MGVRVKEQVGRKKKTTGAMEERFEMACTPEWLARLEAEAARQGVSASAYARQAITLKLDRDEAERMARGKKEGE